MAYSLATPIKNALLDALAANFNNGTIKVYSGAVPADANTTLTSQVLLGTLTMGATAFAAAANGTVTANPITQGLAVAGGTASFYRAFKSDGTTVIEQGAVGTSGAELNLNTTAIATGGPIQVSSLTRSL